MRNMQLLKSSEKSNLNGLAGTAEELHGKKPHSFTFMMTPSVFFKFAFYHLPIFAKNAVGEKSVQKA